MALDYRKLTKVQQKAVDRFESKPYADIGLPGADKTNSALVRLGWLERIITVTGMFHIYSYKLTPAARAVLASRLIGALSKRGFRS